MSENVSSAIATLADQQTELETMIETFNAEHQVLRRDLTILKRMAKQCSKMQTPNGLKHSIEDHRSLIEETISVYKYQIKDCQKERKRIKRALSILNA